LNSRQQELDLQSTTIKTIIFDAKLQYRSNDIVEETYQQINTNSTELLDRIKLEKDEINSFLSRITQPHSEIVSNESEDNQSQEDIDHVSEMESNSDHIENENDEKIKSMSSSGDAKEDEIEGNWLNEVLTKDTA
jgi:Na+/phosphate symporter